MGGQWLYLEAMQDKMLGMDLLGTRPAKLNKLFKCLGFSFHPPNAFWAAHGGFGQWEQIDVRGGWF